MCARVYHFRSIQDSEWFPLQNITCLVGKNGYGKTTILDALLAITADQEPGGHYHYSDAGINVFAELAVPVIEPHSERHLGILRVQRMQNRDYRYLFHPDPTTPSSSALEKGYLYTFCEEKALNWKPDDGWRTLVLKKNGFFGSGDTVVLGGEESRLEPYAGKASELVAYLAEKGLQTEDGTVIFERGWAFVPRIVRIPGETACADSATRDHLQQAGPAVFEHLRHAEPWTDSGSRKIDPKMILRALVSGCLGEKPSAEAVSKRGMLEGLPNSSLSHLYIGANDSDPILLNKIVQNFWDKNFQVHIDEDDNKKDFHIRLQRGTGHKMRPSYLSRGTKWFFGFLSLAISARDEAVRQADFWKTFDWSAKSKAEPIDNPAESFPDRVAEGIKAVGLPKFFASPSDAAFHPPVLFLMDEPATFLHVESQTRWLELMELVTHRIERKSSPSKLFWFAPWFCFATHSPNLVRPRKDLVLAVDRVQAEEAMEHHRDKGKVRQTDSTLIRSPQPYNSDLAHYLKAVACFGNGPIHRVILEGQSDRFWLDFAIQGVMASDRPLYADIILDGVKDPSDIWNKICRNYLNDPFWIKSTDKIIVLFDGDAAGKKARDYLQKKCLELNREENEEIAPEAAKKFKFKTVNDITEIPQATSEDFLPWELIQEFCQSKLVEFQKEERHVLFQERVAAVEAFKKLSEQIPGQTVEWFKSELRIFAQEKTPEVCYEKYKNFSEKISKEIRELFY